MSAQPLPPLPYDASFEATLDDEDGITSGLSDTMLGISQTVFKDTGHARRSVHAKCHGILRGEVEVLDGLPEPLAQGLYARPGKYPVLIRLSTTPGDMLDDNISTPRGMALKIIGVDGERLPGSEGANTQDYVLGNSPAFNVSNAKTFLRNIKVMAAPTDKADGLKKIFSSISQTAEAALEKVGVQSATLTTFAGQAKTHILGDTFYSQAPLLHGAYAAKLCVSPMSAAMVALSEAKLDLSGKPDGIRESVREFFTTQGGQWEVRVQLCVDLDAMPIEDASAKWPEDKSPYVAVARITVGPQDTWSDARIAAVDDGVAFSSWNGLAAHRPLGSIMRARREAYRRSAAYRSTQNGVPVGQPRSADELPE